jgi:hypothetical protein
MGWARAEDPRPGRRIGKAATAVGWAVDACWYTFHG